MGIETGFGKISIDDACVANEIGMLNVRYGIRTFTSCCGHTIRAPFVGVPSEYKPHMLALGYDYEGTQDLTGILIGGYQLSSYFWLKTGIFANQCQYRTPDPRAVSGELIGWTHAPDDVFKEGRFYVALKYAMQAHKGQVDKGGNPYILHPVHLASQMKNEDEKIIALFHDIVEDTEFTLEDIANWGFADLLGPIDCLTKRKDETYAESMERVMGDVRALKVKIADIKHNSDVTRLGDYDAEKLSIMFARHEKWLPILEKRLSKIEG
jgi:hypothetical protein